MLKKSASHWGLGGLGGRDIRAFGREKKKNPAHERNIREDRASNSSRNPAAFSHGKARPCLGSTLTYSAELKHNEWKT